MRTLVAALLLAFASAAFAQAEEVAHPDARVEARLKELGEDLRCLVCQNQTIADSAAPLAQDLRNEIRAQIAAGRSDAEIRAYMVERYGDFVLYKPPFKASTALLWVGPFALLALGLGILAAVLARRRAVPAPPAPDADAERAKIAALLESDRAPPGASKG